MYVYIYVYVYVCMYVCTMYVSVCVWGGGACLFACVIFWTGESVATRLLLKVLKVKGSRLEQ